MQQLAEAHLHADETMLRADRPTLVIDHRRGHRAHANEVLLVAGARSLAVGVLASSLR